MFGMKNRTKKGDKMYVVTHRELSPGAQAVQGMHALREFASKYPEIDREWYENSNYIAFLSVADEEELATLYADAMESDVNFSTFHEPDFNDDLTAICLEPSKKSEQLCKKFELALKSMN